MRLSYPSKFVPLLLLGIYSLACASSAQAQGVLDSISQEVNKVFEKSAPGVVKIRSVIQDLETSGTGFFIDAKGTILTTVPVVGDAIQVEVEWLSKKYEGVIIGKDARSGIALVRIEADKTPFLKPGNSDTLKPASGLISVAFPYNLPAAPSFGLVGGFDVQYLDRFFATTHIRANLPVSPGQIGGPLLNTKGEVMGLMVLPVDNGKSCYAIPINSALKISQDILTHGKARHGWVGVGVMQANPEETSNGDVRVSQIFEGTPAENSGILPGDRVLKIGGRTILNPRDVLDAAFFSQVGETSTVVVEREGKTLEYKIHISERPDSAALVQARMNQQPAKPLEPQNNAIQTSSPK